MIEFSIGITDEKEFKEFLQSSDLDYITIVAMQHGVYFVADSAELYTHITFDIISRFNFKDNIIFRFPRMKLISLLSAGIIKFMVDSESVCIKFQTSDAKPKYSFKCKYQTDLIGGFLRRLELLEEATEYDRISLKELGSLIRFSRSLGGNIRCAKGIACIELKSGSIFKKVNCPTFTCTGKMLYLLARYTSEVYNVQNYLVYTSSNKAIIVTKNRDDFVPELSFIEEAKAFYVAEFTLANVIDISKRIRFNTGQFVLDLGNSVAEYIEADSRYDIDIDVASITDVRQKLKEKNELDLDKLDFSTILDGNSENTVSLDTDKIGTQFPKILVPSEILKNVLVHMGVKSIVGINVKKNFIILKIQGVFVVFGRKNYSGE